MPLDLKETLTRKLGPLPVWAWGGIAGGGVLVLRRLGYIKSAAPADSTGADSSTVSDEAALSVIGEPASVSYYGGDGALLPPGGLDYLGGVETVSSPLEPAVPAEVPPGQRPSGPTSGCSKPHKAPGLGRYPDAPNRECPQGWHLNRVPGTPCFGWCVPN
jgi:hypothetical protein